MAGFRCGEGRAWSSFRTAPDKSTARGTGQVDSAVGERGTHRVCRRGTAPARCVVVGWQAAAWRLNPLSLAPAPRSGCLRGVGGPTGYRLPRQRCASDLVRIAGDHRRTFVPAAALRRAGFARAVTVSLRCALSSEGVTSTRRSGRP